MSLNLSPDDLMKRDTISCGKYIAPLCKCGLEMFGLIMLCDDCKKIRKLKKRGIEDVP